MTPKQSELPPRVWVDPELKDSQCWWSGPNRIATAEYLSLQEHEQLLSDLRTRMQAEVERARSEGMEAAARVIERVYGSNCTEAQIIREKK